ncbi:hypothetical protein Chor_011819 [Crotalus horridus]
MPEELARLQATLATAEEGKAHLEERPSPGRGEMRQPGAKSPLMALRERKGTQQTKRGDLRSDEAVAKALEEMMARIKGGVGTAASEAGGRVPLPGKKTTQLHPWGSQGASSPTSQSPRRLAKVYQTGGASLQGKDPAREAAKPDGGWSFTDCTKAAPELGGGPQSNVKPPSRHSPTKQTRLQDLHYAASIGQIQWLQISLQKAESPDQADINGFSTLHTAALHGRLDCMKMLIEKYNLDVNLASLRGWRPIHLVLGQESKDTAAQCLHYLLSKGADVNV